MLLALGILIPTMMNVFTSMDQVIFTTAIKLLPGASAVLSPWAITLHGLSVQMVIPIPILALIPVEVKLGVLFHPILELSSSK